MRRRLQFVAAMMVWSSGVFALLSVFDLFTLESLYIIWLLGFLAAIEITAPEVVTLSWRTRLRRISILGLVVLAGIVLRRALEVLPESVIP
jgi:hypothetical protein